MKKFSLFVLVPLLMAGLVRLSAADAQMRNVTFRVNTCTVPDTLVPTDTVQIRGNLAPLTWDNLTGGKLMNTPGGDYWEKTLQFPPGDTIYFKLNVKNSAWESNLTDPYGFNNNNRGFIVPLNNDTTLEIEYFNNGAHGRPQYFTPWTPAADSFMNVYFRVNMSGIDSTTSPFNFHKNTDTIAVRGGGPAGADLQWGVSFYLTKESPAVNGGFSYDASNFWSGRLRFPKSQLTPGQVIQYKYLIGYTWGRDELQGQSNRSFTVPMNLQDTTLEYVYYNNMKPLSRVNPDTVIVTFRANLAAAINNRGFAIGDTVVVQSGFFQTAVQAARQKQLGRLGLSTNYSVTDTVVTAIGQTLDYQYYTVVNGVYYRETYYNFAYNGSITSEAERRQVIVGGKTFAILDTAASLSNPRRQPVFPNNTPLSMDHDVRFTLDVRPAFYTVKAGKILVDRQAGINVTNADSIFKWGVMINGPATDTTHSWQTWGSVLANDTTRIMYDDGTHGDLVAHDSIYSRILHFRAGSATVGQEFKFGIGGGDNEGGYGNNHIENLDDSQPSSTLPNQFGSIDPLFYNVWNFDCGCLATGVNDTKQLPQRYALSQNYPNPFNPSTKIDYSIPKESFVTLKIFNLLGQEVATPVNEKQTAGFHTVSFDASKLSSGIYFYRITAGTFVSTKKMTLIK